MRDRISFSEWTLYRECPQRWKLDYHDQSEDAEEDFGIYMDFGTSCHAAIEKYKTRKDPVDLPTAHKIFEDKFRELYHANSEKYKDRERQLSVDEFIAAGKRILDHLDRCKELKEATVLYNEHLLLLPIERTDFQINFKGYIDMVIKTKDARGNTILYIVDFKTCGWGWPRAKKQDEHLPRQLFFYKHFLCKKYNLDPKGVRCAFMLLKRKPFEGSDAVEFFPVSAGPVVVQRALDTLNSDLTEMKEGLDKGVMRKNRKACTNAYGDVCPHLNTERCPGG